MGMQISTTEGHGTAAEVASALQGTITENMNGHRPTLMAVFTARPRDLEPVLEALRPLLPRTELVGATMPEPAGSHDSEFVHAVAWAVTGQGCEVATGMARGLSSDDPARLLRRASPAMPRDPHCPNHVALLLASSAQNGAALRAAAREQFPPGTRILHLTPREDLVETSAPVAAGHEAESYSLSIAMLSTAHPLAFEELSGGVPAPCLPDHQGRVTPRYEPRGEVS